MNLHYQVIVIGAGPAGCACGITLQKEQISNCLIDKASFPRRKTCGGLVTKKTIQQLESLLGEETDLSPLFCDFTQDAAVYEKTTELASTQVDYGFHFVNRTVFDQALSEHYISCRGTLVSGEAEYAIDYDRKTITFADGRMMEYEYLVFADGMNSQSHRLFRKNYKDAAFGIEAFVPAGLYPVRRICLHFGFVDNGYVWVFPKGDAVCIGLGNTYKKGYPYRQKLAEVLKALGISPEDATVEGAFLPYGEAYPQEQLPDNILLIGDAAGFADPINGEGLYFALTSGKAAAEAFLSPEPKEVFLKETAYIRQLLKEGKRLQKRFFRPSTQRLFLRLIKGRNQFLKFYLEEHVQEYRYSHSQMPGMLKDYKHRRNCLHP